jgi:hypothetical protein
VVLCGVSSAVEWQWCVYFQISSTHTLYVSLLHQHQRKLPYIQYHNFPFQSLSQSQDQQTLCCPTPLWEGPAHQMTLFIEAVLLTQLQFFEVSRASTYSHSILSHSLILFLPILFYSIFYVRMCPKDIY